MCLRAVPRTDRIEVSLVSRRRRFGGSRRIWQNDARTRLSAAPLSASDVSIRASRAVSPRGCRAAHPRQETGDTTTVAVKIRLKRMGKIHAPYYRVVIMNSRTKRDGRAIEEIGLYHPTEEPSLIQIDSERVQYWLGVGAQPTEPVLHALGVDLDERGLLGRVVQPDLLDGPAIALGARVHDDNAVVRSMDLAHALQTNLDGHGCGVSCFLSGVSGTASAWGHGS